MNPPVVNCAAQRCRDVHMKQEALRKSARCDGVSCEHGQTLVSLVRAIQRHRGEPDCFGADDRFRCADMKCEWREDCLKPIAIWRR